MTTPKMKLLKSKTELLDVSDIIMEFDSQKETQDALKSILDKVSNLILTIGVVAMILCLSRITSEGWHPNIVLDICFYVVLLAVIALRKHMPNTVVMASILVLAGINSITSFITIGLGTISFVTLATICIITGVFFGVRAGIAVLITSVITTAGIGVLVITGKVPGSHLPSQYLLTPQTWVTQIASFAALTTIMLAVIAIILNKLSLSFKKVLKQTKEIKKREKKYRFLADNMRDMLFVQDMEFNFIYSSPSVENLFGYTQEEILSVKLQDTMTQDSFKRAGELFQQYLTLSVKEDVDIPLMEFEYIRKDGSTFWGEFKPSFLRGENGELIGSQGILRDITNRKKASEEKKELEQKLRQSEKLQAIGQLAGGVAHDFNNQLTGIMGFANLLKHEYPDDKTIIEYTNNILKPSQRATELTDKLLAFARDGDFMQKPVDMHKIIDEAITLLERSIDKTIRIVRNYDIKKAFVIGDATQLENAILNLALNARDAMPKGGQITFLTQVIENNSNSDGDDDTNKTGSSDNYLEISVIDTGVGIDERIRHRIFDPFFTTKERGHGTGMGLSAVYGTISNHNGTVDVIANNKTGTSFVIRLPLTKNEIKEQKSFKSESMHKGVGNILVIEDEDAVRNMIKIALDTLGYSTTVFSDAYEAIEFYGKVKEQIDCVILDIILPKIHGKEVFKKLQSINTDVKVLFISGYTADTYIRLLIKEDAVDFLKKPFTTSELSEKLVEVIG